MHWHWRSVVAPHAAQFQASGIEAMSAPLETLEMAWSAWRGWPPTTRRRPGQKLRSAADWGKSLR